MVLQNSTGIGRAFNDPVLQSQRVFRSLLAATAEPGTIHVLDVQIDAPQGAMPASILTVLALADKETPVWISGDASRDILAYLRFHTGCPIAASPSDAQFAVLLANAPPQALANFDAGDERYPDRSATVIVECPTFEAGPITRWSGPGIRGTRDMRVTPPHANFWREIGLNHGRYPLGVDVFLVSGHGIVGLPRSTSVTEQVGGH